MSFEHLNYSTEDQDDDSIQDCVDREHQNIRTDLSALKNQILSNFETVQVDIFETGSHLNMRSKNGEIIGQLHDNETLHVLGDHILGPNDKIFMHIKTLSGKEGYVSADYIQGHSSISPEEENNTPPIVQDEAPNSFSASEIPENNIEEIPSFSDSPIPRTAPHSLIIPDIDTPPIVQDEAPSSFSASEIPENNIEEFQFNLFGFIRDGAMYIVGENGNEELVTYNDFTEQQQGNIEELVGLDAKINNFMLIIQALKLDSGSHKFDGIQDSIGEIVQNIDITTNPQEINNQIDILRTQLIELTIPNRTRRNYVPPLSRIDFGDSLQVLNYIRNNLSQEELVSQEILNLRFELLGISNENLSNFIADPTNDIASIRSIFGEDEDAYIEFKIDINNKRAEAINYFIENKEDIMATHSIDENDARELVIQSFLGTYTQSLLINHYITHLDDTGYWVGYEGDDELLKLYGDIHGIGVNDFSDKTWSLIGEGAKFLAIEAVAIGAGMLTMGVGTAAVHAAVWGARGYKGIRAIQSVSQVANMGLKAGEYNRLRIMGARALRFGTMGGIEGAGFAVGMGAAKSAIEGENMYTQDMFVHSLGFTYAFRGLTGLYSSLGMRINPEIPLSAQKLTIAGQIGGDGVVFSTLGLGFEDVLFEPGEWSAETILQAFFMAALFRGMGHSLERYKFRKNERGELELLENPIIPTNRQVADQRTHRLEDPIIPPNRRLTQLEENGTPLLANPTIPINRRLSHINVKPSPSLRETIFVNPKNERRYVIFGTPDRIISVRRETPRSGGNGILGGGARNIFIQNNENALLAQLRSAPPINNQSLKRLEFRTPEGSHGGGQTYEIFATQRSGSWEYYIINTNSTHPHSGNLGTAVLRNFKELYGDQIEELLNKTV